MLSNHLIRYHPLLLLYSIFPSIKVFFNESALRIKWPKYWSFSISPSNEYSRWVPLGLTGLISLQSKGLSRVFFNTSIWKREFFGTHPFLWSNSHIWTWLLKKLTIWSLDSKDCRQSDVFAFYYAVEVCHSFSSKEQVSFINFMAAVIIHIDFWAQENSSIYKVELLP